ncbi:hypothetical protein C8R43DRAFT_964031 [Mycena crocata]|nr:hypothetical protein C8R43DRAFT_964031 [Mycena crocata]
MHATMRREFTSQAAVSNLGWKGPDEMGGAEKRGGENVKRDLRRRIQQNVVPGPVSGGSDLPGQGASTLLKSTPFFSASFGCWRVWFSWWSRGVYLQSDTWAMCRSMEGGWRWQSSMWEEARDVTVMRDHNAQLTPPASARRCAICRPDVRPHYHHYGDGLLVDADLDPFPWGPLVGPPRYRYLTLSVELTTPRRAHCHYPTLITLCHYPRLGLFVHLTPVPTCFFWGPGLCFTPGGMTHANPGHRGGFQTALCGAIGAGRKASLQSRRDGGGHTVTLRVKKWQSFAKMQISQSR